MDMDNIFINKKIYRCISRAYESLFSPAIYSGHWKEVRSTALVGLSLSLREPKGSPWLDHIKKWLLEQQEPIGTDMASWGEELWDTSMALISLNRIGLSQKDAQYQKAIRWMVSLYNVNNRQNWHDEPWETSWCILAILETDTIPEYSDIAYNATKWLLNLQDPEGKVVSPHYTAYFILSSYKLISHGLIISQEDKKLINAAIDRAIKFLLNTISKDTLWTGEAWSNGQILWALTHTGKFPSGSKDMLLTVVNWFADHQESGGNWSDVEDTASSILGLYYLLRELESMSVPAGTDTDGFIFTNLQRYLNTPVLRVKRKFIETHEDGTTSINLSPRLKKLVAIIAAIASGATIIITYWDFIKGLIG